MFIEEALPSGMRWMVVLKDTKLENITENIT